MDLKLEVVVVPVSDVDRAKEFYARMGFREDNDFAGAGGFRIVQLTPPARRARSFSERAAPTRRRDRSTASCSPCATSTRRAPSNVWMLQELTERLPGRA